MSKILKILKMLKMLKPLETRFTDLHENSEVFMATVCRELGFDDDVIGNLEKVGAKHPFNLTGDLSLMTLTS